MSRSEARAFRLSLRGGRRSRGLCGQPREAEGMSKARKGARDERWSKAVEEANSGRLVGTPSAATSCSAGQAEFGNGSLRVPALR